MEKILPKIISNKTGGVWPGLFPLAGGRKGAEAASWARKAGALALPVPAVLPPGEKRRHKGSPTDVMDQEF